MPHPIQMSCPRCGAGFVVQPKQRGSVVTCPDCLEEFPFQAPTTKNATAPASSRSPKQPQPRTAHDSAEDFFGIEIPSGPAMKEKPQPVPPLDTPETKYDFSASCPLCGTRQDVRSDQIGTTVKCPDCHLTFKLAEPPRSARRKPFASTPAADTELQLREPVPSDLRTKLSQDWIGAAQEDLAKRAAPPRPITPHSVSTEVMRQAEKEFDQLVEEVPELPRHPFRTGLMRFFSSPSTIARWLLTAIGLEIELGAIEMAIRSAQAGGIGQVFSLFVGMFACAFGLFLFCLIGSSLLLVTQDSAQGKDQIAGWPGINVLEWIFEIWPLLAALFLAFAPGILLGQFFAAVFDNRSWIAWLGVGLGVVSMTLFFPVLLLSFMENSAPYSKPIWTSLRVSRPVWLSFWVHSGSLVLAIGVIVMMRLEWGSGLAGFVLNIGLLFGLLVYFRLLGRLSWACEESLTRLTEAENA